MCINILTKALPLFFLLLKIAYVELMVGESRSMHLCHIYCKIKQWIHGDDKSHKLIKIVHICGWWMMECNTPLMNLWISLSFIWITWGHSYIIVYLFFLFFFMDIDTSIFFLGHASWACHLLFFFFLDSSCPIWEISGRERSLNMEFYFVDGWNGIADFQCRSSAGGVHMILIK